MMTSNRNSSSSSSTMTKPRSRIDDEIGVETSSVAASSGMRVRNPSCSASSTLSSTSSSSSSTALSNNDAKHHHLHNHHSGGDLIDVLVVYPNGFQTVKKLDVRKAIYDILIELAATGKLLPSNYTLKLFASTTHDDNNNNNNFNDDAIIEYTPNQTIGQLNPTKIKIIPKTSTLKHNFQNYELSSHHHNHFSSTLNNNQLHSSSAAASSGSSRVQTLSNNYSSTPFELTNRVQVNLPFNQKTAVRVRLDISLDDLLSAICKEAALERARYDLVINGSRPNSMLDSLSTYNTKEVTLVLKHSETAYVKNSISSKGSHTSQNSTKSRTQAKISSQQQRTSPQIENSSPLNRSKSELDLSTSGSSNSSCQKDIDKRNPLSQKSHNSGSMFGFFTRKRHSKSKNSLCASHSNLAVTNSLETSGMTLSVAKSDEKEEKSYGKYSTSYVSNSSLSKTKKRVAPPPPTCTPKPTPTEKLSLPNGNSPEVSVTVSSRPKPDIIDSEMLEKIKQLTKKKQKKTAAPLPPQSLSPCSNSPSSQSSSHDINYSSPDNTNDAKTSATAKKLFLSMSESSSSPTTYPSPSLSDASSSLSNQDRANNNNNNNNDKRIHISKISNSLVMPVMKTTANNSNDEEEKETGEVAIVKRNSSIQSSSESSEVADYTRKAADYKYRNDCESSVHDSSIASTNASSSNHTCNQSDMQSIQSIPSSIQRDHSTIEIVRNPPSGDNTQFEKSPPSQFNEPDLSLIISNRSSFGRMKKNNGAVADAKIAFSSEENSNSSALDDHHHFIQRQQSNEEEEAPKEDDEDQVEDELNHSITDNNNPHNLHLDTRIPNVFVSENENVHYREHLRTDFEQELADLSGLSGHNNEEEQRKPPTVTMSTPPKRCTAIIEVRPEYVQSSLIRISEPVAMTDVKIQKPLELSMTDSYHFDGQIVRQNISPRVLVDSDQQHQQPNQQQSNGLKLRSPSSPLPQFPAICENEVNQTHGNYVVVRTGDIIEKNGIYYSSDGTIRGYSGTVKKMAGSKTLNEVFLKQQEIEQQHEKEYQIELDSKKRLQQIPEVSSVSRKEENKEKENQHPLPPPPPPPAPPVVVSPSINTNSPVFSGVQAAKQRLSLGNIIANEKKNNYTLSSNSNIFKSAGTTPFRKYPQTINNNDSIENELTKKLENRRQQIANQMMTQQKNETHLRIDTNIQSGKTTVAGSSLASSSNHSEESSSPMSSPSVNSPPKPAASFVMSAKYRTSYQQSFGSAKTATATATIVAITRNEEMPLPPPPPPLPPSMFADSPPVVAPPPAPAPAPKPQSKSTTLPPAVAPKNFKPDTLVSISKKNQLLDARENLLESIKGFNFANLKKVHQSD